MAAQVFRYGLGVQWPYRQLVDIGNRVVCVRVLGRGPTVVLEAGGAGEGTTGAYGGLEERLAAFATVVTYDRAGSGRSDGPPHRRVAAMADDLEAVIDSLRCATPVVVVGWSAGGLVAELFAARHPDKVAGLVLLDPTGDMPTQSRIGRYLLLALATVQLWMFGLASQLGFFRTRAGRSLIRRAAPAETSAEGLYWLYLVYNYPRAAWQTARFLPLVGRYIRETAATLGAASLPDVPVRVLVPRLRAGVPHRYTQRLDAAQRALAERFPHGKLVLVDGSGHLMPIDRPDVVIAAVRQVLGLDSTVQETPRRD